MEHQTDLALEAADTTISDMQRAQVATVVAERKDRHVMWKARIWKWAKQLAGNTVAALELYNPYEEPD